MVTIQFELTVQTKSLPKKVIHLERNLKLETILRIDTGSIKLGDLAFAK